MEIKVRAPKVKDPQTGEAAEATFEFDFGANLEEASKKFTADVVYKKFVAASVIDAQSRMRALLEAGQPSSEVVAKMKEWKPGVSMRTSDPVASLIANWNAFSDERKATILAQLQNQG